MQNRTLPSHRDLITSLITSIAREQAPPEPSSRTLLLTLHVIFPTLVLPALDLLDRKLITRLALSQPTKTDPANPEAKELIRVYAVQSAASASTTSHRRRDAAPGPPRRRYLVHAEAWSCSCAAFALEAYRRAAPGAGRAEESTYASPSDELDFGGLSLDGRDDRGDSDGAGGQGRGQAVLGGDADVPCCKHLLACFLAEKWEDGLGAHIETRTVGKEELAAMVASL